MHNNALMDKIKNHLKRIILLTDGVHPKPIGGMQIHSYNLIKYLPEAGIITYAIIPHFSYPIEDLQENQFRKIFYIKYPTLPPFPGKYIISEIIYSFRIWAFLLKNKIIEERDVVYSQGFTSLMAPKKRNFFIVSHLHGFNMFHPFFNSIKVLPMKIIATKILKKSDASILFGERMLDYVPSNLSPLWWIIPNGIDDWWLTPMPVKKWYPPFKILFVAKKNIFKGFDVLLKAIKILPNNVKEKIILQIVGDWDSEFINKVMLSEITCKIEFLGLITSKEKIKKCYDNAHIFVCSSYSEGLPFTIMEAMARQCAVIASNTGAIPNLIKDNQYGILFPAGSYIHLSHAIRNLINNPEIMQSIASSAYNFINNRTILNFEIPTLINYINESLLRTPATTLQT